MGKLQRFSFEQGNDQLFAYTGLGLAGVLLHKTNILKRFDQLQLNPTYRGPDISNGDTVASYIGLLCQGRNDFDDIELYRKDEAFSLSMGISQVPSSPTLRQRLDSLALRDESNKILLEESAKLLRQMEGHITPIKISDNQSFVPLDIDVSPMDNGNSKKQGVSRTYKGCDGYSPIFSYLGREGYLVNSELREGKQHVQNGTPEFIRETIRYARIATDQKLLLRLDGGNDSADTIKAFQDGKVDYILKCNRRKETKEDLLAQAKENGNPDSPREGKDVYIGERTKIYTDCEAVRQAYRIVERTIDAKGQLLLIPEITVELYATSFTLPVEQVIDLYHDHGTSEQFHSELKTDMDLEQLPSGKFETNGLILGLGQVAYNFLRYIGQESLHDPRPHKKSKVKRKRLRTVIQDLIIQASKLVKTGRRKIFKLSVNNRKLHLFQLLYEKCWLIVPAR